MIRPWRLATILGAKARMCWPCRSGCCRSRRASRRPPSRAAVSSAGWRRRRPRRRSCRRCPRPVGRGAERGDVADVGTDRLGAAPVGPDLADGLIQLLGRGRHGVEAGLTGPAMSIATTSAPFAAISTAIARPMPRAAPVTTATLPASIDPRPGRHRPRSSPAAARAWAGRRASWARCRCAPRLPGRPSARQPSLPRPGRPWRCSRRGQGCGGPGRAAPAPPPVDHAPASWPFLPLLSVGACGRTGQQ